MEHVSDIFRQIPLFILVLFRMGGIFLIAPFFGHDFIPIRIKVAIAFFFTLVIFPTVPITPGDLPSDLVSFGFVAAKETAVGVAMGFFASALFMIFSLAGEVVDRQIGLDFVSILSPTTQFGGSLIGMLYYLTAIIIFLSLNGHHWLIKTLAFSYRIVPVGGFSYTAKMMNKIMESFASFFGSGIKMAAPFIIIAILTLIVVGIVLKITQQTNLFIIELPMRALIGFIFLIISAPFIIYSMKGFLEPLQMEIVYLLKFMR